MNKKFFDLLVEEFDKITCPVCGSKPFVVIQGNKFVTKSCAHQECEVLMKEAEARVLSKMDDNAERPVKLHIRRPDFGD